MKIPKQKTVKYELDGVTYLKVVDIKFPFISYILGWPLRRIRVLHFLLRIHGILKIPETNGHETDLKPDEVENPTPDMTVEDLNIGQPIETAKKDIIITYKGDKKTGQFSSAFVFIDSDPDFGRDVLEFTFEDNQGELFKVYHTPDFFLELMFFHSQGLSGKFISIASDEELDGFYKNLLINDAKSLV